MALVRGQVGGKSALDCLQLGHYVLERRFSMALPFDDTQGARDPRALAILAKTIYRELRASGYAERDVVALASELVGMVASDMRETRTAKKG